MTEILAYLSSHALTLFLAVFAFLLLLTILYLADLTQYLIYGLLIWFPLETFILQYAPHEYYSAIKYLPEAMMYAMALFSWFVYCKRRQRWFPPTPLNKWFVAYLAIAVISLVSNSLTTNSYYGFIWLAGLRQLLRFALLFFIVFFQEYPPAALRTFLYIGGAMMMLEAGLGIVQYLSHGYLDRYLFFSGEVSIGGIASVEGLQQFWAPGQRVFATLGRYDRLGSFLAVGLIMFFPWLPEAKTEFDKTWRYGLGLVGASALILTSSRASWLAAILGIGVVSWWMLRDKRIVKIMLAGVGAVVVYLLMLVLLYNYTGGVLDKPEQSITDRLLEAVSWYSWQQSYEGYGRVFFIIQTPLTVVRQYPLFGVGPGNYGGGVAAALLNSHVYNRLHLPFGIQNTVGEIDNNWLSIWGEVGTLGLIVWLALFIEILSNAATVSEEIGEDWHKKIAQGMVGVVVALITLGFFGPYFEFRALMAYFWLLAGVAIYPYSVRKKLGNFIGK